MKSNKWLLLILVLGAIVTFVGQQRIAAFALLALALAVWAANGSFEDIPPKKEDGQTYPSPAQIKKYREEHPGLSIAQALEQMQTR